jgi:hypothetical protein
LRFTAAICVTGTHPRNGALRSCAPGRSASRPDQTLLQAAQSLGFAGTKADNPQQLPAGQRHRDRHAAIHTHQAAITGSRNRVGDHSKSDVPTPRAVQSDAVGLHGAGDGARAHINNLGSTTDKTKGGKRHFLPRQKPGVSKPQIS